MKKVFLPDINLYSDILPFFQDFYILNKEKNSKFSYRFLALKLKWSAPYLNDVFKGRKKLSLNRALEFINYIDLKGAKAERFLFLFLSDSDNVFSESSIKKTALASRNTQVIHHRSMELEEFEKMQTLIDYYILYYIELSKGVWDSSHFLSKVTLSTKPTDQVVESSLERLQKNGFLKFNKETALFEIQITDQLIFDQVGGEDNPEKIRLKVIEKQEREYAANYLNYLQRPIQNKKIFCSGILNLDMELFAEAQDRIYALRNYLYDLDVKGQQRYAEASGPESRVWQFSMNLFSLFEGERAEEKVN